MRKEKADRIEQECVEQFKLFKIQTGNWPRAQELPTLVRKIQRRFGGLIYFRKKHNLDKEDYRSDIARAVSFKSLPEEINFFEFLSDKYGRVNVHEHFRIYSNSAHTADFCIHEDGQTKFFVDAFHSKDLHSFRSCLNLKFKKYNSLSYPIFLVQLNPNIKDEMIQYILSKRKTTHNTNIKVMSVAQFKSVV